MHAKAATRTLKQSEQVDLSKKRRMKVNSSSNKEGENESSTSGSMNEANCCTKAASETASEAVLLSLLGDW